MRRKWRPLVLIVAALAIGATCAPTYARWASPFFAVAAEVIAKSHPWKIVSVEVVNDQHNRDLILHLTAEVRRLLTDPAPAALVYPYIHVGAVIETPIVFWTTLMLWPAGSYRRRVTLILVGAPIFLAVSILTTVCQLLVPLAWASAILEGNNDPVTIWDIWSRFLEDGGRFVIAFGAAVVTLAICNQASVVGSGRTNLPLAHDCRPKFMIM